MQHSCDVEDEHFYECLNCNENWKLKDPDHGFSGYFLRVTATVN